MRKPRIGVYVVLSHFERRTDVRVIGKVVRKPVKKYLATKWSVPDRRGGVFFWWCCCYSSDGESWYVGGKYAVYAGSGWKNVTILSESEAKRLMLLEAL